MGNLFSGQKRPRWKFKPKRKNKHPASSTSSTYHSSLVERNYNNGTLTQDAIPPPKPLRSKQVYETIYFEQTPSIKEKMKQDNEAEVKLQGIKSTNHELRNKVDAYTGSGNDLDFRKIKREIIATMIKLDDIETDNETIEKNIAGELVKCQKCLDDLRNKVSEDEDISERVNQRNSATVMPRQASSYHSSKPDQYASVFEPPQHTHNTTDSSNIAATSPYFNISERNAALSKIQDIDGRIHMLGSNVLAYGGTSEDLEFRKLKRQIINCMIKLDDIESDDPLVEEKIAQALQMCQKNLDTLRKNAPENQENLNKSNSFNYPAKNRY